jgi:hypothetical protein
MLARAIEKHEETRLRIDPIDWPVEVRVDALKQLRMLMIGVLEKDEAKV